MNNQVWIMDRSHLLVFTMSSYLHLWAVKRHLLVLLQLLHPTNNNKIDSFHSNAIPPAENWTRHC